MKNADNTIQELVSKLQLNPHPEGGYFKEIYRSSKTLDEPIGKRNLATSIYYLLPGDVRSKLHVLKSDEIWYFHSGSPLRLVCIDASGKFSEQILSDGLHKQGEPQVIVPSGTYFGAEVVAPNAYALVGCMVAPGFDFTDFIMPEKKVLLHKFPQHANLIEAFT